MAQDSDTETMPPIVYKKLVQEAQGVCGWWQQQVPGLAHDAATAFWEVHLRAASDKTHALIETPIVGRQERLGFFRRYAYNARRRDRRRQQREPLAQDDGQQEAHIMAPFLPLDEVVEIKKQCQHLRQIVQHLKSEERYHLQLRLKYEEEPAYTLEDICLDLEMKLNCRISPAAERQRFHRLLGKLRTLMQATEK